MTTPDRLIQLGLNLGFCEDTGILDLCCGYGEMLRLWNDVFGIRGTGVDICPAFIERGRQRQQNPERVKLLCADALHYADDEKYDVVCCTEFFGDIKDIAGTIAFLEKYAKPNGKLIFGRLFSKTDCPPKPLTDFDGEIETLAAIHGKNPHVRLLYDSDGQRYRRAMGKLRFLERRTGHRTSAQKPGGHKNESLA